MLPDLSDVVQFFRAMPVTNAECCSDAHVMCRRCAAAALAADAGPEPVDPEEALNAAPEDDILPPRPPEPTLLGVVNVGAVADPDPEAPLAHPDMLEVVGNTRA